MEKIEIPYNLQKLIDSNRKQTLSTEDSSRWFSPFISFVFENGIGIENKAILDLHTEISDLVEKFKGLDKSERENRIGKDLINSIKQKKEELENKIKEHNEINIKVHKFIHNQYAKEIESVEKQPILFRKQGYESLKEFVVLFFNERLTPTNHNDLIYLYEDLESRIEKLELPEKITPAKGAIQKSMLLHEFGIVEYLEEKHNLKKSQIWGVLEALLNEKAGTIRKSYQDNKNPNSKNNPVFNPDNEDWLNKLLNDLKIK